MAVIIGPLGLTIRVDCLDRCVRRVGERGFHLRGEVGDCQSENERDREFQAIVAVKLQLGKKVA